MRAVRNTDRGIEVVDVPDPGDDGVRVSIRSSGICGTDLTMTKFGPSPITLGHEFAGVLDDGTAVAVEPIVACGRCDQCAIGARQRCRLGIEKFLGTGADGGMTEEIRVPADTVVPLGPVAAEDACLAEPLAVSHHGLRLAGVEPGARVAVIGGGTIGLTAVAAARAAGADVYLAARHPHQAAAGERLGAIGAVEPGGEYDFAVEAAGTESALVQAAEAARPGGTVVMLGTWWTDVPVPGVTSILSELRFVWSIAYGSDPDGSRDFDEAATILAANPEIAATLITHRFPLEDAAEAFRVAADRSAGAIKVVLEP